MRILVVGDTHANTYRTLQVIRLARTLDIDTIFQVGDFGFWPRIESAQVFLRKTSKLLKEADIALHWVDGNHEDHDRLDHDATEPQELRPHLIWHPRGTVSVHGGRRVLWMGGAVSVDLQYRRQGVSWFPSELPTFAQFDRAVAHTDVDILIAHEAPSITNMTSTHKGHILPAVLTQADGHRRQMTALWEITQPELYLHGHWHSKLITRLGDRTVVALGADTAQVEQMVVIVDTADLSLTWVTEDQVRESVR